VPVFAESLDDAFDYLAATIREGDLVLVVGAGDVNALAPRLAAVRPAPEPPPVLLLSAYGTRAPAPGFRIAASLDALRAALAEARAAGTALRVLGAPTRSSPRPASTVPSPASAAPTSTSSAISLQPRNTGKMRTLVTRHSSLVTSFWRSAPRRPARACSRTAARTGSRASRRSSTSPGRSAAGSR